VVVQTCPNVTLMCTLPVLYTNHPVKIIVKWKYEQTVFEIQAVCRT